MRTRSKIAATFAMTLAVLAAGPAAGVSAATALGFGDIRIETPLAIQPVTVPPAAPALVATGVVPGTGWAGLIDIVRNVNALIAPAIHTSSAAHGAVTVENVEPSAGVLSGSFGDVSCPKTILNPGSCDGGQPVPSPVAAQPTLFRCGQAVCPDEVLSVAATQPAPASVRADSTLAGLPTSLIGIL